MSKEDKLKQKKYELIEKAKKKILKGKQLLNSLDKESRSDVYTSGEIHFRIYCHLVGYGDQVQKLIYNDKTS